MKKRGQVSLFVILAIVIVALIVLTFIFYPRIESFIGSEDSPNTFLKRCIEPAIQESVETLSKQGGYANPEGFILYKGERVKYLCYTAQYYIPCYVQQPLLRAHFENELENLIEDKANECVGEMRSYYDERGYQISGGLEPEANVKVNLNNIAVNLELDLALTKDTTRRYDNIEFGYDSQMYSLLMTAVSIIDFESTYGDSETLDYVRYYPNLKIGKYKLGDGSTVYELEDVRTGEMFTFASRSLAWPGGLGL
ncbi:MAG: hypothetical protein KC506_00330 [Nanoarchaeota archaeon]|nr:hypothetical protein [Nanoarchaeota archaeon]